MTIKSWNANTETIFDISDPKTRKLQRNIWIPPSALSHPLEIQSNWNSIFPAKLTRRNLSQAQFPSFKHGTSSKTFLECLNIFTEQNWELNHLQQTCNKKKQIITVKNFFDLSISSVRLVIVLSQVTNESVIFFNFLSN